MIALPSVTVPAVPAKSAVFAVVFGQATSPDVPERFQNCEVVSQVLVPPEPGPAFDLPGSQNLCG